MPTNSMKTSMGERFGYLVSSRLLLLAIPIVLLVGTLLWGLVIGPKVASLMSDSCQCMVDEFTLEHL